MKRYLVCLLFPIALSLALTACGSGNGESAPAAVDARAAKSPDGALLAGVQHLRDNDLRAFLHHSLPADVLADMRAKYEASRSEEVSAEQRQQFEEQMRKLTASDAEQQLMAELRPALQQYAPQIPMMVGFGQGMLISTIQQSEDLNASQKADAVKTIEAVGNWLSRAELASEAKAEQAIGVVVGTARKLNLKTMDDVRALSFDQMLERASLGLEGSKKVLDIYGLSLDDTLRSMRAEVVDSSGEQATVRVSYTLLGTEQSTEANMVKVGDGWYGRELMDSVGDEG